MKIGSVVFATNSGLGILAKDFYDNGIITDVLIVEHGNYTNQDWYGDSHVIRNHRVTDNDIEHIVEFIKKIDCLFLFETNFFSEILDIAKQYNKKIILMPMYESTPFPVIADLYICPSILDSDYYNYMYSEINNVFIPVPVNSNIKWKQRTNAKHFIHNAGNESAGDRNGTKFILDSLKYIESPIELTIRYQINKINSFDLPDFFIKDDRVTYVTDKVNYESLWSEGDVFLFPERWNALSLPIQEAYSSGMLVMSGNRYPLNSWLPNLPLIDIQNTEILTNNNIQFHAANYDPKTVAKYIDNWYNKDISSYSKLGKQWKENNSWSKLKSIYIKTIEGIL